MLKTSKKKNELSPFERGVLIYVETTYYKRYLKKIKKLRKRNPEKFKERIRKNRELLKQDLIKDLGEIRGLEIFNATSARN